MQAAPLLGVTSAVAGLLAAGDGDAASLLPVGCVPEGSPLPGCCALEGPLLPVGCAPEGSPLPGCCALEGSPLPGSCVLEGLVLLAGDDAPDDPDTAGLVVAGVTGACAGDFVAGDFVAGDFVAGDFVAGDFVTGDFVAGDFVTGDFVAGVVVVAGSLDAEADAGWAGEVVGGVGPVHSLFVTR